MDNWYFHYTRAKERWSDESFLTHQKEIMLKVKHSLNANEFPKSGEVFTLPSMTIPDQALTVREIMDRYSRGLPLDGQRVPIYEGEEEGMPDFRNMDLSEIEDYKLAVAQELADIKKRLNDQMKKATTEEEVKQLKEELAKFKAAEQINQKEKDAKEQADKTKPEA